MGDVPTPAAALDAYRTAEWSTQAHTRLRWASAPMIALEQLVPTDGRILDLGCGHGLFSIHMALSARERMVSGVDIDATKIHAARQAATEAGLGSRARFNAVDLDWRPGVAEWDAIVIMDVLYLLGPGRANEVVSSSMAALRPGGVIIVKEMADRPRWKRRFAIAQEQVAVRVLHITAGFTVSLLTEAQLRSALQRTGGEVRRHDLSRGSLHPHVALVARSPDRAPGATGRPSEK